MGGCVGGARGRWRMQKVGSLPAGSQGSEPYGERATSPRQEGNEPWVAGGRRGEGAQAVATEAPDSTRKQHHVRACVGLCNETAQKTATGRVGGGGSSCGTGAPPSPGQRGSPPEARSQLRSALRDAQGPAPETGHRLKWRVPAGSRCCLGGIRRKVGNSREFCMLTIFETVQLMSPEHPMTAPQRAAIVAPAV